MMIQLVKAELHRVWTTRSLAAFPLATLAYLVLSFGPALTQSAEARRAMDGNSLLAILRGPGFVVAVAMLLLGGLATASDLRHSTIVATLLAGPGRRELFLAKVASVAVVAMLTALMVEALSATLGIAFLSANDVTVTTTAGDALATALAVAVTSLLYGTIGVALGFLLREPTAVVGGAIAWIGIVEGAIPIILRLPWLFKWMPSGLANSLLGLAAPAGDLLHPAHASVLLVGLAALLIAAAAPVFLRRDIA